MKKNFIQIFLFCGVALMLAAFPVFAQEKSQGEIEINKKPLLELADLVIARLQKNEVTLSQPFLIEVSGELAKDGKFDRQKTRYIRAEGDEQITGVAKSAIEAVSDSGIFYYLRALDIEKFNLIFAQNDKQFYAVMKIEQDSVVRARTTKSSFDMVINIAKMSIKGEDEKTLLSAMTVSNEDKSVSLKFDIAKPIMQEMVQRKLSEEIKKRLVKER